MSDTNSITAAGGTAGGPSPLSAEQLLQFRAAETARKNFKRTLYVAKVDAQLAIFFAVVAIACVLISDWSALVIGLGLAVVAFNSHRGSRRLQQLDPTATTLLARNQFLLAAFLTLYFLWGMYATYRLPDSAILGTSISAQDLKDLESSLKDYGINPAWLQPNFIRHAFMGVYALCILATVCAQGLMALYYTRRGKRLQAYLEQTPQWILDLQRAQVS